LEYFALFTKIMHAVSIGWASGIPVSQLYISVVPGLTCWILGSETSSIVCALL